MYRRKGLQGLNGISVSKLGLLTNPTILTLTASPLAATAFLLVIYLLLVAILPPGGYFSGDQGVNFAQIDALARTHTLSVGTASDVLSVSRPSFDTFFWQVGGNYQAIFSPAYAAVVLPFYLLLGMRGLVIPSVLGILLAAYGSGLIGKTLGARYPAAIVLVVGLASPLIFYAFILWEHALSVGLIVMATYLALKSRFVFAGVLVAVAVWFRPEIMVFGPALALAILVASGIRTGIPSIARFVAGLAMGIAPWWVYNLTSFGTVLGPQVSRNPITAESRLGVIALHLVPMGQVKWVLLLAAVLLLLVILRLTHRPLLPAYLLFAFGVVAINLVQLDLYMKGAATSVTDVFPFAFMSLVSLIWLTEDRQLKLVWVLTGSYLLGVVLATPTWGGGGWGPRMLLGVFPLLAVLGWIGLEKYKGRLVRFAGLALLVSSLIIQLAGLRHLAALQTQWTQINAELDALEPKVVATAVWWLPQVGTPTEQRVRWYGVRDASDAGQLVTVENCFWWVWTNEPTSDWWEFPLHHVAGLSLPNVNLNRLEVRELPARGLEAVHYCVAR
jgi:hypothetical protein